jgi:hypothetical protein
MRRRSGPVVVIAGTVTVLALAATCTLEASTGLEVLAPLTRHITVDENVEAFTVKAGLLSEEPATFVRTAMRNDPEIEASRTTV